MKFMLSKADRIAKAYEEHVRPLVACALKKITSTEKGVLTND